MTTIPGFRFRPTAVELLRYFLKRKLVGKKFHDKVIAELDIYKHAPWDLPYKSYLQNGDLEWYFFCPIVKKHGSGGRLNRATQFGFWKATGKDRAVQHNNQIVGMIKTLVFHTGKAPHGNRTDWVIHEYRLEDKDLTDRGIVQDSYVICKVFQKEGPGPRNGAQYGRPFNEEDWSDDDEVGLPELPALVPGLAVATNSSVLNDAVYSCQTGLVYSADAVYSCQTGLVSSPDAVSSCETGLITSPDPANSCQMGLMLPSPYPANSCQTGSMPSSDLTNSYQTGSMPFSDPANSCQTGPIASPDLTNHSYPDNQVVNNDDIFNNGDIFPEETIAEGALLSDFFEDLGDLDCSALGSFGQNAELSTNGMATMGDVGRDNLDFIELTDLDSESFWQSIAPGSWGQNK